MSSGQKLTEVVVELNNWRHRRDEFEEQVFEMLFGYGSHSLNTAVVAMENCDCWCRSFTEENVEDEMGDRLFSYQSAQEALAEVNKSLQLLFKIKEYFACPYDPCEDTEENCEMRELIDRLAGELS